MDMKVDMEKFFKMKVDMDRNIVLEISTFYMQTTIDRDHTGMGR